MLSDPRLIVNQFNFVLKTKFCFEKNSKEAFSSKEEINSMRSKCGNSSTALIKI